MAVPMRAQRHSALCHGRAARRPRVPVPHWRRGPARRGAGQHPALRAASPLWQGRGGRARGRMKARNLLRCVCWSCPPKPSFCDLAGSPKQPARAPQTCSIHHRSREALQILPHDARRRSAGALRPQPSSCASWLSSRCSINPYRHNAEVLTLLRRI